MRLPSSACMSVFAGLLPAVALVVFPTAVSAAVTVNEFSPYAPADWVELLNTSTESADLAGLRLRDGSASNKKDLSGILDSGAYTVIPFSNYLNRTGDTVFLIDMSEGEERILEQVSYGDGTDICAPEDGQTVGRQPDGDGAFDRLQPDTSGMSNSDAVRVPCPSASPTPAPTVRTDAASALKPTTAPTAAVTAPAPVRTGDTGAGMVAGTSVSIRTPVSPTPFSQDAVSVPLAASVPPDTGDDTVAPVRLNTAMTGMRPVSVVRALAVAAIAAAAASLYTTLRMAGHRS